MVVCMFPLVVQHLTYEMISEHETAAIFAETCFGHHHSAALPSPLITLSLLQKSYSYRGLQAAGGTTNPRLNFRVWIFVFGSMRPGDVEKISLAQLLKGQGQISLIVSVWFTLSAIRF